MLETQPAPVLLAAGVQMGLVAGIRTRAHLREVRIA